MANFQDRTENIPRDKHLKRIEYELCIVKMNDYLREWIIPPIGAAVLIAGMAAACKKQQAANVEQPGTDKAAEASYEPLQDGQCPAGSCRTNQDCAPASGNESGSGPPGPPSPYKCVPPDRPITPCSGVANKVNICLGDSKCLPHHRCVQNAGRCVPGTCAGEAEQTGGMKCDPDFVKSAKKNFTCVASSEGDAGIVCHDGGKEVCRWTTDSDEINAGLKCFPHKTGPPGIMGCTIVEGTTETIVCAFDNRIVCWWSPYSEPCPPGHACDAEGHCVPIACASDPECPPNFDCKKGKCSRRRCEDDAACDNGWPCVIGWCYDKCGRCEGMCLAP